MILTPTQIKQLCTEYNLSPSKKYGQNYLISESPIKKMIEAAEIKSGDIVYEIGPGFGILTFELLKAGARVRAFEIEQKLRPYWEKYEKEYPNLEIIWGNALRVWNEYVEKETYSFKVVANLPYQITSEAFEAILESPRQPERMVCMVQKEVAERIVAKPGEMSILAVSIQYFGTPRIVGKVSRGSFFPSPAVDSAVIAIKDIHAQKDSERFFKLVNAGFHHKRKMLVNNLAEVFDLSKPQVQNICRNASLIEGVRAEELSVSDWVKLDKLLTI